MSYLSILGPVFRDRPFSKYLFGCEILQRVSAAYTLNDASNIAIYAISNGITQASVAAYL